jgi:hypothetical protein
LDERGFPVIDVTCCSDYLQGSPRSAGEPLDRRADGFVPWDQRLPS